VGTKSAPKALVILNNSGKSEKEKKKKSPASSRQLSGLRKEGSNRPDLLFHPSLSPLHEN